MLSSTFVIAAFVSPGRVPFPSTSSCWAAARLRLRKGALGAGTGAGGRVGMGVEAEGVAKVGSTFEGGCVTVIALLPVAIESQYSSSKISVN